nr:hypothetical protein [Tanacetum cinerariifolium]
MLANTSYRIYKIETYTSEPSPSCLNDDNRDESKNTDGENDLEAHYTNAEPLGKALPRKGKDPGSFTLSCFINNMCFNKALADLGASPIAPTTAEQRLARKNELNARGTLWMALLDKHQLKLNIHKDAKSLMEAIEKRFGGNKETKKASEAYQPTRNSCTKVFVFALPNVDTLSDAIIYSFLASQSNSPQLDNDDLKQIDVDDLEEMDLKWQMTMLTMRAKRFLQRTRRNLGANGTTSIRFDMSKVECYNCHKRRHFARECRSPKDTRNKETQRRNVQVETSTSNALVSQDIKLLKLDVMLRDNALVDLRKKFEKAEQERDELKLKLENFQTSSNNLSQLLASQMTDKTGLGYDNHVFHSTVFDSDELISSESDVSMPTSPMYDRYKSRDGYHVVPSLYTGTFMPPKSDLDFHDAPTFNATVSTVLNVEPNPTKPNKDMSQSNRTSAPIIEDWDCDYYETKMVQKPITNYAMRVNHQHYARMTHPHPHRHVVPIAVLTRSRLVPLTAARPVTTAIQVSYGLGPQKTLTFLFDVQGNSQHALKDKGVIDSGCLWHMTGNVSYLYDFEEINEGYVAFCGNPKGGKITGKDKIRTGKLDFDDVYFIKELKFNLISVSKMRDKKNIVFFTYTKFIVLSFNFKLPDDNHVLLRVPRENNMYNVDLKNIVPSGDLTCLFAKATFDESNLWHRRLCHINFKTMNKLVNGNLVRGLPSKVFKNNHTCVACKKGKQHGASCKSKPVSSVSQTLQRTPSVSFMRPFGCLVTILNTLDPLGKFVRKADEGFLVGYSSMNCQPVVAGNQPNSIAGIQEPFDADKAREGNVQQYVIFPLWSFGSKDTKNTDANTTFEVKEPESEVHVSLSSSAKTKKHDDKTKREAKGKSPVKLSTGAQNLSEVFKDFFDNSINGFNAANMPALEDITYFNDDEEDVGVEADFSNLETNITVSHIPTTRVHKVHPVTKIIGDLSSAPQTRSMTRMVKEQETKRVHQALKDPSWIEAMQEEILQFKMQKVWVLVDFPKGKRAIGSKYVFRNKKDKRSIVFRNKARLVAQGNTQEEGIVYEEVFAPVARIKAIRLFLAYASFMGFMVYQMDVKCAFLYGTIEEEVYVCQPPGFKDHGYPDKVYNVVKALYGLHQAHRAWYETLANYLLENGFQRGKIDQTLFIKKQKGDILLVQVYVDDIIFGSTNKDLCKAFEKLMKDKFQMSSMDGKSASTPIDTEKPFLKDPDGKDMDVHTYRSMIGLLLYLTSSRPDIMFAVCTVVATSSIEAECVAAASCCAQVLWIQNHNEALAIPGQTTTGKENSNLFMADSLPKTIFLTFIHGICINMKINDVVLLQALIDTRKVIITEDTVRQALRLDDAKIGDLSSHNTKYTSPSLIQEVFANMTRVGKGFSGVDTLLFEGILVPQQVNVDVVADAAEPTLPSPTTTPPPLQQELIPLTLQDKIAQALEITKLKQRVRRLKKKCKLKASRLTRLRKVRTAQRVESSTVTAAATTGATTIIAALMPAANAARRRKGVVVRDPEEITTSSVVVHSEPNKKDTGQSKEFGYILDHDQAG